MRCAGSSRTRMRPMMLVDGRGSDHMASYRLFLAAVVAATTAAAAVTGGPPIADVATIAPDPLHLGTPGRIP
jgi:hypothetical protein